MLIRFETLNGISVNKSERILIIIKCIIFKRSTMIIKVMMLLLMCGVIGLGSSSPVKGTPNIHTRFGRSPADNNFSLFGFNLASPLSILRQPSRPQEPINRRRIPPLNAQFYNPESNNNKIIEPQHPSEHIIYNTNSKSIETDVNALTKPNMNDKIEYQRDKPKESTTESFGPQKNELVSNSKEEKSKNKIDAQVKNSHEIIPKPITVTKKDNEIDQTLLDYIFKETTTTEATTSEDYSGTTSEYDTSTIDELLRIPAPVVASLLG